MNRVRLTAGLGAATAMCIATWVAVRPPDAPARGAEPPPAGTPTAGTGPATGNPNHVDVVTRQGCTGVACHGVTVRAAAPTSGWGAGATVRTERDRWRSSATAVWAYDDPHTHAFQVLGNELSRQIERLLTRPGAPVQDARADTRCLACHANPTLASHPARVEPGANDPRLALFAEGVGCEACHGNARGWVGSHAGWSPGPSFAETAVKAGMTPLWDPQVRAETCVGCHIGAPARGDVPRRDMNHDLIAAGHPRLNFDYATYLRALPPHWLEKDRTQSGEPTRPAADEFRHWQVGRAVMAAASCKLREDRAKRGPWPELAEFDCYSCHHNLGTGRTNHIDLAGGTVPGSLVWNDPFLAEELASMASAHKTAARPGEPMKVQEEAAAQSEVFDRLARDWKDKPLTTKAAAQAMASVHPNRWDEACQLFYGLLAIDRAADPGRTKPEDPALAELRKTLALPRDSEGARFNCPATFDPNQLDFAAPFRERGK